MNALVLSEFVDEADLTDFVDRGSCTWKRVPITVAEIVLAHGQHYNPRVISMDDRNTRLERLQIEIAEALRESETLQLEFWECE